MLWKEQYKSALASYQAGNNEEAKKQVQALLVTEREQPEIWCLEAQIRLANDEWEAAEFAIEQALLFAPDTFAPYHLRACLLNASTDYQAASRAAHTALRYATTDQQKFEAHLQKAEALFGIAHHQLQSTVEEWDDDEDSDPIMTPEIQKSFQKGLQVIEQAIDIADHYPEAWELYANYLAVLHRTEESLEAWKKAVELAPDQAEYLHGFAQALEDVEDFEAAHRMYRRVYELDAKDYPSEQHDTLLFSPKEFAAIAQDAWNEVEHELQDESFPLMFVFHVASFPERLFIENASAESLFDPRVGLHVELQHDPIAAFSKNPEPPTVHLHLFQVNVERDLDSDDPHLLHEEIEELLADCIEQIYEYMGLDDEDA